MDQLRVAVTLVNGRSHVLRLPDEVTAEDAVAVLRGETPAGDVGWSDAEGEWLPFEHGQGWVHKSAIAEIAIVDYAEAPPFLEHEIG